MNCPNYGYKTQAVFNQLLSVNGCAQPATQNAIVLNPTIAQPLQPMALADARPLTACAGPNIQTLTFIKF